MQVTTLQQHHRIKLIHFIQLTSLNGPIFSRLLEIPYLASRHISILLNIQIKGKRIYSLGRKKKKTIKELYKT